MRRRAHVGRPRGPGATSGAVEHREARGLSAAAVTVRAMATFTMVEFPTSSAARSAGFLQELFGWRGIAYGPDYHDVPVGGGMSLGFQADRTEAPAQPLVVIEVDDLATMRAKVLAAGGAITLEAFSFPGGGRMHVREPGGNEIALYVPTPG